MFRLIMITYHIPLTGLKVSTNKIYAGIHWTKRKESADAIHSVATGFCRPVQKVQSYPVEIRYKFVFVTRPLDTLNCAYMAKCIEDAFRAIGILEDDSPSYVARTIIEVHEQSKGKSKKRLKSSSKEDAEKEVEDRVEIIINSI